MLTLIEEYKTRNCQVEVRTGYTFQVKAVLQTSLEYFRTQSLHKILQNLQKMDARCWKQLNALTCC